METEAVKLDRLDRKILLSLDHNSRISLSDLSRQLRLGRDIVSYRIDRLRREGVIKAFVATVNPYRIGFSIFKTYLRLNADRSRTGAMMRVLKSHKSVLWQARSDGTWDLMLAIVARSPVEAYELQR